MGQDEGASDKSDRATHEPSPSGLGHSVSVPSATHTAELKIGHVTLVVHHLDNGQRVIEEQSMIAFMDAMANGSILMTPEEADQLARAVR